jgi:hypothetical protein
LARGNASLPSDGVLDALAVALQQALMTRPRSRR